MSDSPFASLALGYLAAGPATETAREGAMMLTRALQNRRQPSIDVNYLVSVMQQMEAHISQQDAQIERNAAYIADLQREARELRVFCRKVEADRDKLLDWAEKAEEELKRWRSGT